MRGLEKIMPNKELDSSGQAKNHIGQIGVLRREELTNADPDDPDMTSMLEKEYAYDLLDYIEQFYYTNQYVPSIQKASDLGLNIDRYDHWIRSRPFREKLAKRGIILPGIRENLPENALTGRQLAIIKALSNPADGRSRKKLLADEDVPMAEFQGWMHDPKFTAVLHAKTEAEFLSNQHEALMSVLDGAMGGDMSATKLYLEMTGRHRSGNNGGLNMDLAQLINLIVEIIQDEVKDREVLNNIGRRMVGVVAAATKD
jgi:hypothetical protein